MDGVRQSRPPAHEQREKDRRDKSVHTYDGCRFPFCWNPQDRHTTADETSSVVSSSRFVEVLACGVCVCSLGRKWIAMGQAVDGNGRI